MPYRGKIVYLKIPTCPYGAETCGWAEADVSDVITAQIRFMRFNGGQNEIGRRENTGSVEISKEAKLTNNRTKVFMHASGTNEDRSQNRF
jgi:hypothetical protein